MSGPVFKGAAIEPHDFVAYGAAAVAFVVGVWRSIRSEKATKATKVAVENAATPTVAPAVTAILAELASQVASIISQMATKEALNTFSASQDTFKSAVLLEIGQFREAGRALGEQFPQFKKELNEKVDGVVEQLKQRIAEVESKIPAVPVAPVAVEPIAG